MATVVQLMDSVGFNRGGLTKAIYDRLHLLSNNGFEVILIITSPQYDVVNITNELKRLGVIPENTIIKALFDESFSQGLQTQKAVDDSESFKKECFYSLEHSSDKDKVIRYFNEYGAFLGLDNYSSQGVKRFSDIHRIESPHEICKRIHYDSKGRIRKVEYYDSHIWKPRFETVYSLSGNPIYSCWISENGSRYRVVGFCKSQEDKAIQYSSFQDMQASLLKPIVNSYPECTVISDEPNTVIFLSKDCGLNCREGIGFIHTTHDYVNASGEQVNKPWLANYTLNQGVLSKILTTNDQQAIELRHIIAGADKNKIFSVYHGVVPNDNLAPKQEASGRLLYLGRLSSEKRVDLVLKGFAKALNILPNLSLDIVGDGPVRKELEALADNLNISNSVVFHGYTHDVNKWYRLADCQFLVSKFEGFGLVLIEGLANGCPAIVTPCKYGPDQVIIDNINGLRAQATSEGISQAIISLYTDDNLLKLSAGALDTVGKYSKNRWQEKWLKILGRVPNLEKQV